MTTTEAERCVAMANMTDRESRRFSYERNKAAESLHECYDSCPPLLRLLAALVVELADKLDALEEACEDARQIALDNDLLS